MARLTKTAIASKKRQALQFKKDKPQLTSRELANLTGLSQSTIERTLKAVSQDVRKDSPHQANITAPSAESQPSQTQDDAKTPLDFEESPAPVEKKGVVDSALSSLKGMLGIADKKDEKTAQPVFSAKLDARRQQFVDSAAPTLSLAFMALAAWLWGRIGPEYRGLAPDEKVADRIVTPFLRVYARHANFMTDINPDVADIMASVFALVGYVHVSLGLYQEIKAQKEADDEQQGTQSGWRTYRAGPTPTENGTSNPGNRYADVRGANGTNGHVNGGNGGSTSGAGVSGLSLSDKEARQYEALSRLAQLDYQHRARRSGIA